MVLFHCSGNHTEQAKWVTIWITQPFWMHVTPIPLEVFHHFSLFKVSAQCMQVSSLWKHCQVTLCITLRPYCCFTCSFVTMSEKRKKSRHLSAERLAAREPYPQFAPLINLSHAVSMPCIYYSSIFLHGFTSVSTVDSSQATCSHF